MPRCLNCQNEVDVDTKFCKKCGSKTQIFADKASSDVIIPADETMAWDNNMQSPSSNPSSSDPSSNRININISNPPPNIPVSTQRSGAWYLLPIFFTLLGGIIAWAAIRHDDPKKAKNCLIIGIIITLSPLLFFLVLMPVGFF